MKKIFIIYGGTSLISIELLKRFNAEADEFIVINRDKEKFNKMISNLDENLSRKINSYQIDLNDLENNLSFIDRLENSSLSGVIFVIGETGDPHKEFADYEKCIDNYKINLIHPVVILNSLINKLKKKSFICVFTSMAGIRGRSLRIHYCSAKSGLISYLSGLRQKLFNIEIDVINVIAGYMDTEKFNINSSKLLITSPKKVSKIVYNGIKKKKENIYTSKLWKLISIVLLLIPETIFKKLKF